jgi:hypothetical protein
MNSFPTAGKQRSVTPWLPLLLAAIGSFIQIASAVFCGRYSGAFFRLCAGVGIAVSVGAVICGHIVVSRSGAARWPSRLGLAFAYLSLLTLPVLWFGFLWLLSGMHDSM